MGAFGIVLTLPISLAANAMTVSHVSSGMTVAEVTDASVPQRWRNYALASITPAFSWAPAITRDPPQITDAADALANFALNLQVLGQQPMGTLNLSIAQQLVDNRVQVLSSPRLDVGSELPDVALKRTIVAPSLTSQWGAAGSFGVTAILAYQRFASLGLGEATLLDGMPVWPLVPGETSYGAGMRLDVGNTLFNRLSWNAAYQSRVNMDALKSLRGVYSDPGQFDIPADTVEKNTAAGILKRLDGGRNRGLRLANGRGGQCQMATFGNRDKYTKLVKGHAKSIYFND